MATGSLIKHQKRRNKYRSVITATAEARIVKLVPSIKSAIKYILTSKRNDAVLKSPSEWTQSQFRYTADSPDIQQTVKEQETEGRPSF